MRKLTCVMLAAALLLISLVAACGSSAPDSSLSGGILATFEVQGESYRIFITNPSTIDQVLALQAGNGSPIPNGKLVRGQVSYNQPWSWHIDSEDISMVDFTVEIYDGLPSHVENDLDYWLDTVGRFAPWQAELTSVEDFR